MEQLLTTYTVKSKNSDNVWVFKYDLNGLITEFKRLEGVLSENQIQWFFFKGKFPHQESQIQEWIKNLKANFQIEVGQPDLSFDMFWKLYPYNALSKKKIATERFNKLKESDKIKIMLKLPEYKKLKAKENTAFPYAEVFINQRWWDN